MMRRKTIRNFVFINLLVMVLLFSSASAVVQHSQKISLDPSCSDAVKPLSNDPYEPHNPILISSDDDFKKPIDKSGVRSGSGTEDDPYIISGWKFEATTDHNWNFFIEIWNTIVSTDAYVVIKDNYFSGNEQLRGNAIELGVSHNIIIEGNVFDNIGTDHSAIWAHPGACTINIVIKNNEFSGTMGPCIFGWDAEEWSILDNEFNKIKFPEEACLIDFHKSTQITISNNKVDYSFPALYWTVGVMDSCDIAITYNTINLGISGLLVHRGPYGPDGPFAIRGNSENITIEGNNILISGSRFVSHFPGFPLLQQFFKLWS